MAPRATHPDDFVRRCHNLCAGLVSEDAGTVATDDA
jgi:hypothetical protein